MIISAYSNRIYKQNICSNLEDMLIECNNIKIIIYSKIKNNKLNLDEVNTTYIINNYHINTYFANMIIREIKAILSSNEELQIIYIDDITQKINNNPMSTYTNCILCINTNNNDIINVLNKYQFVSSSLRLYLFNNCIVNFIRNTKYNS